MASLYISEYDSLALDQKGEPVLAGYEPSLNTQKVTFSTSAASNALDGRTRYVRVVADAACHISFGASPTATTNDLPLQANSPEYFGIKGGSIKIAAVAQ